MQLIYNLNTYLLLFNLHLNLNFSKTRDFSLSYGEILFWNPTFVQVNLMSKSYKFYLGSYNTT